MIKQTVQLYPHKKKLLPLLVKRAGEARWVYNKALEQLEAGYSGSKEQFLAGFEFPKFLPVPYRGMHIKLLSQAFDDFTLGKNEYKRRKEEEVFELPEGAYIKDKRVFVPEVGMVRLAGGKYHREGKAVHFQIRHKDYKWYVEVEEEKDEELNRIRALQHWDREAACGERSRMHGNSIQSYT